MVCGGGGRKRSCVERGRGRLQATRPIPGPQSTTNPRHRHHLPPASAFLTTPATPPPPPTHTHTHTYTHTPPQCKKNPAYMESHCGRSCGACEPCAGADDLACINRNREKLGFMVYDNEELDA